MSVARHIFAGLALVAGPLTAAPIERIETLPDDVRVIDIRAEAVCARASLPGARCLPPEWLFHAEGGPIDFGALRWLLGTLGLDGSETVAIWPGDAPDAEATAALLHLAGQARVTLYAGQAEAEARGETRSFSREAVFAAPMRLAELTVSDAPLAAPLTARLEHFARGGAEVVAFGPAEN